MALGVAARSQFDGDRVIVVAVLAIPLLAALVAAASVWRGHLAIAWAAAATLAVVMILGAFTVGAVVAPSLLTVSIACALNTGIASTPDTLRAAPPVAERHPPTA